MSRTMPIERHDYAFTDAVWKRGVLAAVIAAIGNVLVYGVAQGLDLLPRTVEVQHPAGEGPVTLALVIGMTMLPVIVATLLLALLQRITRRPARLFRIVGAAVLVLSLAGPFGIPDVPMKMALTLVAMHLVAGIVALVTLPERDRE